LFVNVNTFIQSSLLLRRSLLFPLPHHHQLQLLQSQSLRRETERCGECGDGEERAGKGWDKVGGMYFSCVIDVLVERSMLMFSEHFI
jgi:hypothetical protein